MSLPQWSSPRKPRRLGLWAPFAAVGVGVVLLTAAWFWMRDEIGRRMDLARGAASMPGWTLNWGRRSISGFPFRLDVSLDDARVREPSGWGLAAPRLEAEAFIFAPTHWVLVAPRGVVITRRRGGPLHVNAKALRASVSDAGASPPRISVEGLDLTFVAPPTAAPFVLRSAREFHLHTKAGPEDQGAFYVEFDGADALLPGLLGRIAAGRPATFVLDGLYTQAASFRGPDWPSAARAWSSAGGRFNLRSLHIAAGEAVLDARTGELEAGRDGRLRGRIDLSLRQAPKTLGAMADEGALPPETARAAAVVAGARQAGAIVSLPLSFQAGQTTLGPIAVGPAPRIY